GGERSVHTISSTVRGWITLAVQGVTLPHPHSACSPAAGAVRVRSSVTDIDAAEEQEGPCRAEREQRPIAQDQLLRRLARSLPDQGAVAGEPQHERNHGEGVPDYVRGA